MNNINKKYKMAGRTPFFGFLASLLLSTSIASAKEIKGQVTDAATGKVLVKVNPEFFRPAEVELLIGNPAKAEEKLGWKREITFDQMVERMVATDLALVNREIELSAK